jgi:ribose/xylose/arabinose/galactoside ABC-type transport system permease subunit
MAAEARTRPRAFGHESLLLALLALEVAVFSLVGSNFATAGNAGEIVRASAEVGLLALALTAVILTGGIDLSGGALIALCAVTLGASWRDGGLPIAAAAALAVAVGLLGGGLNALLVARLGVPPLIVTLGTYSLFRGLAEALTRGVENYSRFPGGFLFLGQGFWAGVPCQALLLLACAAAFWVLVHRSVVGRGLRAIGFSPEAARHAGIPVGRWLALSYLLSGLLAGLASLVYVSRLGQAKADAATGFELTAITAVVLGGTSIFGGRGTVHGTVLGVLAVATLQNGLRLADQPSELAGILLGALLLVAIGAGHFFKERTRA